MLRAELEGFMMFWIWKARSKMLLFSAFFVIIGISEFITVLKNGAKKDIIIYSILMVLVFAFAWFFYADTFRRSFVSLLIQ